MPKGYLALVLHSHLPYVRHPEHEDFLEEDWFYEGVIETYIPLIEIFESLIKDGVDFRLTLSMSPTLVSMLIDPLLQSRTLKHIENLIELAQKEVERTKHVPEFNCLAKMYLDQFNRARKIFSEKYHCNLTTAFKNFSDAGKIEITTCAATHGYLPLMDICPEAVRAQIKTGINLHEKVFGKKPGGIWLPECGYHPGHEKILNAEGIKFFFTDTHGILHGSPRPKYGVFAPVYCKGTSVTAFGRDIESSKAVWSAKDGYPGDFDYREFYRDIGFDLDFDYIKPYIHKDGIRINTGIKYFRITGLNNYKEVYNPDWAREKAAQHAGNFMFNRAKQIEYLRDYFGREPIIVSPYDTELFGHWWFEGPQWLNFLLRKIHFDQDVFKLTTPIEYLEMFPRCQVISPSMSSWGWKGYNEFWLEGSNDWVYRHLHEAALRMAELTRIYPNENGYNQRLLNQAARELMLAQSSDWAFIMKTQTTVEYAIKRTKEHIERFTRIYEVLKNRHGVDENWLKDIEWKDNIFSEIDYRIYK
jgi:1,4-alpha-glucan branching enzyme